MGVRAEVIKYLSDTSAIDGRTAETIMERTGISRPSFYRVLKTTPAIKVAMRPKSPRGYYLDVTDESLLDELSTMAAKRVLENKLSDYTKLSKEDKAKLIAPVVKSMYLLLSGVMDMDAVSPLDGSPASKREGLESLQTYAEYQLLLLSRGRTK